MKIGFKIGLWFLVGFLPILADAQSLFKDSYKKWKSSTYLETQSTFIPTTIPGAEFVVATHHNKQYLIHKSVSGEPFAVEWLFQTPFAKDQSDRSLEKQLAGMVLWALDNQLESLLWSYLSSPSFTVKNTFLKFDKTHNKQLLNLWEQQKITFKYNPGDKFSELIFVQGIDTICSIQIHPKLSDILGGNSEIYTQFLFTSLDEPIIPRPHFSYGLNESSAFPAGLLTKADASQPILKKWLEAGFTDSDFTENASMSLNFVTRDTLHYSGLDEKANTLNHLVHFLSAFGEQKAIGVLSSKNENTIRFLLLFKHTELGFEHVLRIDQTVNNDQKIEYISILGMILNPITDQLTSFDKL